MELVSIAQLKSVNSLEKIQALNTVGIFSIRDMAEFDGCRHAELIIAYAEQENLEELALEQYIDVPIDDAYLLTIAQASFKDLTVITEEDYDTLFNTFSIETLGNLADFAPYQEAIEIVRNNILGEFYEKPSAPDALMPKMIGSTHTQVGFSNYVKEVEKVFKSYELNYYPDTDEPDPANNLLEIFYQTTAKFHLGYLGAIHQKWINMGTHLGEPIHSIALAPGESRNIAVIDWYRRQESSRDEDTTATENLRSEFIQTRALNEVVQSTANEHLVGGTEIDAKTKTTGYGLVGGMGGGNSAGGSGSASGSAGLSVPLEYLTAEGALGGLLGMGANSSMAGSLGGSLVHSNGTVQGTLKSETAGEREVMGEVVQNIADATVQNSSSVRSVMSTVVVEDRQSGRQRAQTRNIANYNHSHALNMQYYEVLQTYRIKTGVDSLTPMLFLPFRPISFDIAIVQQYWYLFGKAIKKTNPKKFGEYSQVVKDYDPDNISFDATGNVRITNIKATYTNAFTSDIRVEFNDKDVVLAIPGQALFKVLQLTIEGAATYVDDNDIIIALLRTYVRNYTDFRGVDSFEIDENITMHLTSTFRTSLELEMKNYVSDSVKTPVNKVGSNQKDNELPTGSNQKTRTKLREDVDQGKYSIIDRNSNELDLAFDFEYTLEDTNGQEQILKQSIALSYTIGTLDGGFTAEVTNITDFVNTQLTTVTDLNPTDIIEDIENHFRFHKYGYTKYLLAHLEKEQLIDVVEHLGLSGGSNIIPLTALIDPNPLGITENLLIFKLKYVGEGGIAPMGEGYSTIVTSDLFEGITMGGSGFQKEALKDGRNTQMYQLTTTEVRQSRNHVNRPLQSSDMILYVDKKAGAQGKYPVFGNVEIRTLERGITRKQPLTLSGTATLSDDNVLSIAYTIDSMYGKELHEDMMGDLDISIHSNPIELVNIPAIIDNYRDTVAQYEEQMRARSVWSKVFLPTSGVFGEAILGISNASEYLNIRRFYNWIDSPIPNAAPGILDVNVNQDYTQPVSDSLNPTVPVSVLNQISPQAMPTTSLDAALQAIQNGSMFTDMSKSEQLSATLSTLAELANNTAQQAGNLAGDAGANSLNAAVELGKQVAGMVNTAMQSSVASPPKTQTEKGAAGEEIDKMKADSSGKVSPKDEAIAKGLGTPVNPPINFSQEIPEGASAQPTTYNEVEMQIESMEIIGGERFSDNIIELLNTFVGIVAGDLPSWFFPEMVELFRPYSTLVVKGTMSLKLPNGMVAEKKNFSILSTDALVLLKDGDSSPPVDFNPYNISLLNPIQTLNDLEGVETLAVFSNIDPVSVVDLVAGLGMWGFAAGMFTGIDEIPIFGTFFTLAEYAAVVSNGVLGSNIYSQNIEYLTNLRTNWTQSGLGLYLNNKSTGFDYVSHIGALPDICIAIPSSIPHLTIE